MKLIAEENAAVRSYGLGDAARDRVFCRSYPAEPQQVPIARSDVAVFLGSRPATPDVLVCVSELVTNAVTHSRSGLPDGHLTVLVRISADGAVTVVVTDDGGPWAPSGEPEDIGYLHGLGIAAALSAASGIAGDEACRLAWCAVPAP
jgi:two-component sensor histidine kinase